MVELRPLGRCVRHTPGCALAQPRDRRSTSPSPARVSTHLREYDEQVQRGVGEVLVWQGVDEAGVPQNCIPLVSVTVIPLPPGVWAALFAAGLLSVPRAVSYVRQRTQARGTG